MAKTLTLHKEQTAVAAPATLDLAKLYGVVYGEPRVKFVQDGKQFDRTGKEILPKK